MRSSSEDVLKITGQLKQALKDVSLVKEALLEAMHQLEEISHSVANMAGEISGSTEEQVIGVEAVVESMENLKSGMDKLAEVLESDA